MGEQAPPALSDDESIDSDDDDNAQSIHHVPFQAASQGSSRSSNLKAAFVPMASPPVQDFPSYFSRKSRARQASPLHRSFSRTAHSRESYRVSANICVYPPQRFTSRTSHPREYRRDKPVRHSVYGTSYSGVSYDHL